MGCASSSGEGLKVAVVPEPCEDASSASSKLKGRKFTLGDFTSIGVAGEGNFGTVRVVLLKDKEVQVPMALKIMYKKEIVRLEQVEHVKNERDLLRIIQHTYIVNCIASWQDAAHLYVLMDFINGGELAGHLSRQGGQVSNDDAMFYASELLLAISYLHSKNIIYRDLKPSNVLMDMTGHLKITDLGFAKLLDPSSRTYSFCGTPEYMAPEIVNKIGHDKGVDWWAFGVVIYEMLQGFTPFMAEEMPEIFERVKEGEIDFPGRIQPKAKELLKRLLERDPSKRMGQKVNAEDIRKHVWFKPMNWAMLDVRRVVPPYVPQLKGRDDMSCFERCNDIDTLNTQDLSEDEQLMFTNTFSFAGDAEAHAAHAAAAEGAQRQSAQRPNNQDEGTAGKEGLSAVMPEGNRQSGARDSGAEPAIGKTASMASTGSMVGGRKKEKVFGEKQKEDADAAKPQRRMARGRTEMPTILANIDLENAQAEEDDEDGFGDDF